MPKTLADKLTAKVKVRLDGKEWPIVFGHNELIECEELTGLNALTGETNIVRPSAKLMRALVYVALKRAGARYTLEEVGNLIGQGNIVSVREAIVDAWSASMPEPESEEGRPTQAAR